MGEYLRLIIKKLLVLHQAQSHFSLLISRLLGIYYKLETPLYSVRHTGTQ